MADVLFARCRPVIEMSSKFLLDEFLRVVEMEFETASFVFGPGDFFAGFFEVAHCGCAIEGSDSVFADFFLRRMLLVWKCHL